MFGELTAPEIEELLTQQLVGRIGCYADGITYVVPVSYVYDGVYIYVHTQEGMKMAIMHKNPQVCFQADNTKNLSCWQSVIAWGEFEELVGERQKKEALKKLSSRRLPILSSETMHITPEWPFSSDDSQEMIGGIFFRLKLTKKTGRFEKIAGEEFFAT